MAKARKSRARADQSGADKQGESPVDARFNLGGILGNLGGIMEQFVKLAESGEKLSRSGEFKGSDPQGKLHGVYGFSVKTALGERGEREVKVEPFGNVRQPSSLHGPAEDVREPLVDVHEEDDHVLVLAEIPGVSKKDVELELSGDRLSIAAQRHEKRYRKEIALPGSFTQENMRWDCANGILKIRLER
jgi:HSP20 family protein